MHGNEDLGPEYDDRVALPEFTTRYTLMNGSEIYFIDRSESHDDEGDSVRYELYSGSDKEHSVDLTEYLLPSDKLVVAGEMKNSLYFYVERKIEERTYLYLFFKYFYDKNVGTGSMSFQRIYKEQLTYAISFLSQQPYFQNMSEDQFTIIESFDGQKTAKIAKYYLSDFVTRDLSYQLQTNRLFVRKGILYFTVPGQRGNTFIYRQVDKFVIIEMHIGDLSGNLINFTFPTSIYAQDDSLIYLLYGQLLLVIGDDLKYEIFEMKYPHCSIGGAHNGRLFLNTEMGFHYSVDLGEKYHRLKIDATLEEKPQLQRDEGFESANNTSELLREASRDAKDVANVKLEEENRSLRHTLELLTNEKNLREDELARVKQSISDLRVSGVNSGSVSYTSNDALITRSLREVRAMAQLDNEGFVRYNSTWIERPPLDWQFEADEEILKKLKSKKRQLLCKYSLTNWLSEYTTPTSRNLPRMKLWFKQMVSAVDYLHNKHLIHRDLKPCNILFVEKDRLKLCDLGIVKERKMEEGVEITATGTAIGTEMYMSPEQHSIMSQLSAKSDVFTLGLIFAELCVVMEDSKKLEIFNNYRNGKQENIFGDARTAKFVNALTDTDRKKRPTCSEMLEYTFLQ